MTTVAPPELELSPAMLGRYQNLSARATRLRGRRSGDRSWLLVAVGATSVSLGLMLVVLGYVGASHTIYVFEQIPYLISGGILGGCLVLAGGFSYFAFWLTRLHAEVAAGRATDERAAASLEHVELLLQQLLEAQLAGRKKVS
jgi:hypothetical protein